MIRKILTCYQLLSLLLVPLALSQERAVRPVNTVSEQLGDTGRYFALLLAIEDYADQDIPDLEHPIKDARKLESVLEQHYQFDEIQLLENPTRRLILENFEWLRRTITREDNLLVFYAGHGDWEADSQTGYWLPQDAQVDSSVDWIPNSRLVDVLRGIKSRHTLLITDACFSGSIFKTRALGTLRERAFSQLHSLPSRKAMTSGALKTVPDRSVFLEYLVKRLEQNQEPLLSSEQLFSSFKMAVINNSPNQQVPQYGDIQQAGDEGGDFIFIKTLPSVPLPPSVKPTELVDLQAKADSQRLEQQRLNEALSERLRIEGEWKEWQQKMQEDYERVLAFEKQAVGTELKIESWQRFLDNWIEDNLFSQQDEELRSYAKKSLNSLKMGDTGDTSVQARLRLADLLNQKGNKAQAIQVLLTAATPELKISSKYYASVYLRLGDWNQDRENWSEALKYYQSVQRVDPKNLDPEVKTYVDSQVLGLRKYLGTLELANAIEKKDWLLVSKLINKGLKDEIFQADVDLLRAWLEAEKELERWSEVLAVYDQLEIKDSQSVKTIYDYKARGQAAESTKQIQKALEFYSKAYELAVPDDKANWALYIADRQQDSKEINRWQSLAYQQTPADEQLSLAQKLASQAAEKRDWVNEQFWLAKLDKDGNSEAEMQALWRQVEQAKIEKNSKIELEVLQKILMRKPAEKSSWFTLAHYRLGQLYLQSKRNQDAAQSFLLVAQADSPKDYSELKEAALRQWKSLQQIDVTDKLIELEKKEDWAGLSYLIRKEQMAGMINLDEANFSMLIQAEIKQQNWKGVLRAYQLLEQEDKPRTITAEALLIRARATQRLEGWQAAISLYEAAITAQPKDNHNQRYELLNEARAAFEESKKIKELVSLLEHTCPNLSRLEEKNACVELIIFYALQYLNDDQKALKWITEISE